jgi:hypothetical protein
MGAVLLYYTHWYCFVIDKKQIKESITISVFSMCFSESLGLKKSYNIDDGSAN